MPTHILMNAYDEHELRVAVIRDGRLESLVHERLGDGQNLGNIYKARVANVEPSLDAAFLDLGGPKNGFIHISEVIHQQGREARIESVLKPGDEVIVQVIKEAIKDKGPCMSMYLSLPGRDLVLMHNEQARGVSKRIEDPLVRRRLKKLLDTLEPPPGFGFIVRTHAAHASEADIRLDYEYLKRLWAEVEALAKQVKAPACLYQEADVIVRTLRDIAGPDTERIIIDHERLYDEARAFAQVFMPELADKIALHREELPLFSYYGLEERLAAIYDRKVELPSGGAIVIEQTEALVSIDVNSAKNRESSDVETTALMTNLEAAQAIAEQLVLRDLGGLIVIDFIDMEKRENQRLVQVALRRALAADRAKIQVGPMSRFGLVELTRQRQRPSHKLVASSECPYCGGTGSIKTAETFEIDLMREIRQMLHSRNLQRLEVVVPADLVAGILNNRRKELTELEERTECRIVFNPDALMKAREFRLIPTARKGGRRDDRPPPVRPSLLAPLMVEQAKAIRMAQELAAMKPEDIERELASELQPASAREAADDPAAATETARPVAQAANAAAPAAPPSAPARVPELWEEAAALRRLLFSPPRPVLVVPAADAASLARPPSAHISAASPPRGGRRHRR
ncbi:MAG: Rne/Rng family ribonuclease [Planctomycetes bacterium]|nr:Rne/Rng family ribonuclease [Planctomycetota bacterium]